MAAPTKAKKAVPEKVFFEVGDLKVELTIKDVSALEACDAEDFFGDSFDVWIAALLAGRLRALLVLLTVLGRRTNPTLTFADVGALDITDVMLAFAKLATDEIAEKAKPQPTPSEPA